MPSSKTLYSLRPNKLFHFHRIFKNGGGGGGGSSSEPHEPPRYPPLPLSGLLPFVAEIFATIVMRIAILMY